jgi:hypothetical protein
MSLNIVEKILKSHLREGDYKIGTKIGIRIDQTLTQDATGTMAYLQFEAMGLPKLQTDLSVSYVDHNTVQVGFENAADHRYLQTIVQHYGLVFADTRDYDRIEAGAAIEAPGWRNCIKQGQPILLQLSGQAPVPCTYNLSERQRNILLAGGLLNYTTGAQKQEQPA